jgi:LysM repeat protein
MRAAEREADEADYAEATGDYPQGRLGRRPSVSSTRHHDPGDRDRPPARRERVQGNAPSWEKARRSESFPMLKGRGDLPGLPGLPRVWVLFGALVIAAVALFFLPQLLDVGGQGGEDPTPTPATSSAAATPTPEPTPEPEPTPQLYVIKQGDTLSKVAAEFGVTLEELLAANVDRIEDPDRISIGDEIIIPTEPPEEVEGGGASAAPSP